MGVLKKEKLNRAFPMLIMFAVDITVTVTITSIDKQMIEMLLTHVGHIKLRNFRSNNDSVAKLAKA